MQTNDLKCKSFVEESSKKSKEMLLEKGSDTNDIFGWKCFMDCGWKQYSEMPEPPFTNLACGCCMDFECPECGSAVNMFDILEEVKK